MEIPQIDTQIAELISKIVEVSPAVWESALKQVKIDGLLFTIGGGIFSFILFCCLILVIFSKSLDDEEKPLFLILVGVFFLLSFLVLITGIKRFYNPEWYALKEIIKLLTNNPP